MTRLFGYFANQVDRIRCAFALESDALSLGEPLRADGWGVGSFQGGEVLLRRKPLEERETLQFHTLLRELRTDCAVAHLRTATVGARSIHNTHPFRYRQWLFAHNGTLPGVAAKRREVLDLVPDFLARNLHGDTDSELVFHVFLAMVHRSGRLDDPEFDRAAIAAALRETVAALQDLGAAEGALNVVLTNGRAMVALRRGHPMAWVQRRGIRDCAACRRPPMSAGRDPQTVHHESLHYVMVASGVVPTTQGWREVPEGERGTLVSIDRGLDVQVTAL